MQKRLKDWFPTGCRDPSARTARKSWVNHHHAGLNTVLDSLSSRGLWLPSVTEQPGIGRIRWTGTGEVIPLTRLSIPRLRATIQRVLTEDLPHIMP